MQKVTKWFVRLEHNRFSAGGRNAADRICFSDADLLRPARLTRNHSQTPGSQLKSSPLFDCLKQRGPDTWEIGASQSVLGTQTAVSPNLICVLSHLTESTKKACPNGHLKRGRTGCRGFLYSESTRACRSALQAPVQEDTRRRSAEG